MGTATYFSPEQARGAPVDPRSDLYSLGCVLYEMTTGHPPFAGDSAVAIAYKHVQENPIPPRRFDPALPETLEAITLKCLAKNPANRYPSAQDLRADLRRYLDGSRILAEPVLAPPVDPGATAMMATTGYGDQTALVAAPTGYQRRPATTTSTTTTTTTRTRSPSGRSGSSPRSSSCCWCWPACCSCWRATSAATRPRSRRSRCRASRARTCSPPRQALEAEGFTVATEFVNDPAAPNLVIGQDPGPGEEADEGSTVTLRSARVPRRCRCPT